MLWKQFLYVSRRVRKCKGLLRNLSKGSECLHKGSGSHVYHWVLQAVHPTAARMAKPSQSSREGEISAGKSCSGHALESQALHHVLQCFICRGNCCRIEVPWPAAFGLPTPAVGTLLLCQPEASKSAAQLWLLVNPFGLLHHFSFSFSSASGILWDRLESCGCKPFHQIAFQIAK